MPNIFDPAEERKPDNPERRAEMPPENTLIAAGLRPRDILLDIGCGSGYFTLPAAGLVGPNGKVYALDISAAVLSGLRARIAAKGIFNIETLETGAYDLKLPAGTATIALLSDVLHEVDDKPAFLTGISRVLRTGAILAIIEWNKNNIREGPPLKDRLGEREIHDLLDRSGFTAPSLTSLTPSHDLYVCRKKQLIAL